jgi:MoxR-like ATPase
MTAMDRLDAFFSAVNGVMLGKEEVVRLAATALLARGHVLLEDVPGVGKTLLARALARGMDLEFQRVQFTADMMPADILGVTVFSQTRQEFEFAPGPVFTHVLLADEINRATPKTQSALLEAMQEGAVSLDRRRRRLPEPFFVLATQNPLEFSGTFPLPESQMDRFALRLSIGYPGPEVERELMRGGDREPALEAMAPALDRERLLELQRQADAVHVADKVLRYLHAILETLRTDRRILLGPSPRAGIQLARCARAHALIRHRAFVTPDDVLALVRPVLAHRMLARDAGLPLGEAVKEIAESVPVPV